MATLIHRPLSSERGSEPAAMPLEAAIRFSPGYYCPYSQTSYRPSWWISTPYRQRRLSDQHPTLEAAIDAIGALALQIVWRIEIPPRLHRYDFAADKSEVVRRELARPDLRAEVRPYLEGLP